MNLSDRVSLMTSDNYKERFKAEYYQTKIRYEKLKALNTKIEASHRMEQVDGFNGSVFSSVAMPIHSCSDELLREQQSVMGQYLHLLEVRAVIEEIEL